MTQVFHFLKLGIAVVFGVASVVAIFMAPQFVIPCAAISVAWSLMPE